MKKSRATGSFILSKKVAEHLRRILLEFYRTDQLVKRFFDKLKEPDRPALLLSLHPYFRAMTALACASMWAAVRPKRCCRYPWVPTSPNSSSTDTLAAGTGQFSARTSSTAE